MKMTQCERIIKYMKDFGSITSAEAMSKLGVFRLASRINDLKNQGYVIYTKIECGKNRYGEPTHYARYSLNEFPKCA